MTRGHGAKLMCAVLVLWFSAIHAPGYDFIPVDEVIFVGETISLGDIVTTASAGETDVDALATDLKVIHPTLLSAANVVSAIDRSLDRGFSYTGGALFLVPEKMKGDPRLPFLNLLKNHVLAADRAAGTDVTFVINGAVPVVREDDTLDFFELQKTTHLYEVMYRRSGRATYRPAGVDLQNEALVRRIPGTELSIRHPAQPQTPPETVTESLPEVSYTRRIRIKAGEDVVINLISGSIRAEFSGKALDSGYLQDSIRVEIEETGKQVKARIVGVSEVRVDL